MEQAYRESVALIDRAKKVAEGWITPNGALLIPAAENFERDKQVLLLPCDYRTSAAFFHSAFDVKVVALVTAILDDNVKLQNDGQCLYKEPVGGHPKHLHQDSAYFQHRYDGPVADLCRRFQPLKWGASRRAGIAPIGAP